MGIRIRKDIKDHEIASLVGRLTDIAKAYHDHQSLRQRISQEVNDSLSVEVEATKNPTPWLQRSALVPAVVSVLKEQLGHIKDTVINNHNWQERSPADEFLSVRIYDRDELVSLVLSLKRYRLNFSVVSFQTT